MSTFPSQPETVHCQTQSDMLTAVASESYVNLGDVNMNKSGLLCNSLGFCNRLVLLSSFIEYRMEGLYSKEELQCLKFTEDSFKLTGQKISPL